MAEYQLPAFYNMVYTDRSGRLTADAYLYNDQTFQTLNQIVNFFNDGLPPPSKSTTEITDIEPSVQDGTIWWNNSLSALQVRIAPGVVKTIQVF